MNWPIFIVACIFWWMQNQYFGWNAKPQSDAEMIVDGITVILIALAIIGWR